MNMVRIKDFPNYSIDEYGNVFSHNRNKFLTPHANKQGYLKISLFRDGKSKLFSVHRLVAETFLPNPGNLPQVNHKDLNKANNSVCNLEWCTSKYNVSYGGELSPLLVMQKAREKPVVQILNGIIVGRYKSASEAQRATGIQQGNISRCCLHRKWFKSAGGYQWEYDIK